MSPASDTQLFRDVFNACPIGIVVENLEGQPLFVNPAFCRFLRFSEHELRSKHCIDFSPREEAEKDWVLFQKLRAGSIDHYSLEKRYFRRDGSLVWGRLNLSLLKARPYPLVIAMVEDITEQKAAEQSLRASEERLRLAQQVGFIGTFERNVRTGLVTSTAELERMYGLPSGAFVGTTIAFFENLIHPDDLTEVKQLIAEAVKSGQPTQGEWRVIWPDGSLHWIAGRWRVFRGESGEPTRMIGVNMDVTERKQAEQAVADMIRKLIEAQEHERLWIGRELHDNINQRLAMLAVELEQIKENPAEVESRVQNLRKEMNKISKDVQSLSHDLHSSQLEYLGVVEKLVQRIWRAAENADRP